mmetsp:Transcript_12401/g.12489  ORF Transcript_12401/g.12489 Transcript_12401/m.12489 type:complete len:202 (-) Transcript_12401:242-847(-)
MFRRSVLFSSTLGAAFTQHFRPISTTVAIAVFYGTTFGSKGAIAMADDGSKSSIDDLLTRLKKLAETGDTSALSGLIPDEIFSAASKKAHAVLENGVVGKIGYGFVMGYISGLSVKKISKSIGVVLGAFFISVQYLAHYGYLQVNYEQMEKDVEGMLDLNKDGKLDEKDLKYAYDDFSKVAGYHMPSGGGFATGLVAGLRA